MCLSRRLLLCLLGVIVAVNGEFLRIFLETLIPGLRGESNGWNLFSTSHVRLAKRVASFRLGSVGTSYSVGLVRAGPFAAGFVRRDLPGNFRADILRLLHGLGKLRRNYAARASCLGRVIAGVVLVLLALKK